MVQVPVGESVKLIDSSNPNRDFEFQLSGNGISLGRSKLTAGDENAKQLFAGDRGEIKLESGESLYGFGVDSKANGKTADINIEKAGFIINFQPRSTLATVETTAEDREAPARSDDFVFESGSNVTLPANGTITEEFEAPDRADSLGLLLQSTGDAELNVLFQPTANGQTIAQRGPTQDPTYSTTGGAANQVFKSVLIVAPHIEVDIVDNSGASNQVDYAIYAR